LHVNEHTGGFGHGGIANVLHHERKTWPRRDRKSLGAAPHCALQGDGGGQLIFHLNETTADRWNTAGESLYHLGGGSNGVAGREASASCQCAFATGVIAVHKMDAG
jgi:hypothetical protein